LEPSEGEITTLLLKMVQIMNEKKEQKPFYEMSPEELNEQRANTSEYFSCNGHFIKRKWDEAGDIWHNFKYSDGEWVQKNIPQNTYIDEYSSLITEESAIKMINDANHSWLKEKQ
jgi:hypothetical protein